MISPEQIHPRTAGPGDVLRASVELIDAGATGVMATVVARRGSCPATPGQKLLLSARTDVPQALGTVGGGALELKVLARMLEALASGESAPFISTFKLGAELGMCCGGAADILFEPLVGRLCALVVGAGHVGLQTASLLDSLAFDVVLVDEREDRMDHVLAESRGGVMAEGFARSLGLDAHRMLVAAHDDPDVADQLPTDPARIALVVATHDHQLDQRVVEWGIQRGFGFVGGVGSRAKAERTRQRMSARGFSEADCRRLRMPVGHDVLARTPAELAVAIGAELVNWRAEVLGTARRAAPIAAVANDA